ncbi:hypothetical protein NDU88_001766 [Pleurodeles waltl]|uniref:Uncharacterized protein n=1 Tax=Pleurodeles waltl TaxID=8319 RepID=A0AAV7LMJ1_PLEWA|nr:hypothetical protein NDU88_001766 [Pleurodeles waltl]
MTPKAQDETPQLQTPVGDGEPVPQKAESTISKPERIGPGRNMSNSEHQVLQPLYHQRQKTPPSSHSTLSPKDREWNLQQAQYEPVAEEKQKTEHRKETFQERDPKVNNLQK